MDLLHRRGTPVVENQLHPYYPTTLTIQKFVSNDRDLITIASIFSVMWMLILGAVWFVTAKLSYRKSVLDKVIVLWFVLCGTMHIFFEGYFVLSHATFGRKQDLFAQLWKEYAMSDSRYISGDMFVLCAESITALVLGPLSYLTAVAVASGSPWRHPLQTFVSLAHFYGDLLYLSTSLVDLYAREVSFSRPEPYYLWFYFIFMNAIWLVVPGVLLYQSTTATVEAFSAWQEVEKMYQERPKEMAWKEHGNVVASIKEKVG